ncbi:MAG: glycine cleavage system aminomethyltransferase GcvT [Desulfatirhabdiaceae bacterium]
MIPLHQTVLHDSHLELGARMVDFGGWDMPVQYPAGIVTEHLQTRKQAGIFDVSHMGRLVIRGQSALDFLQHVLTNNAAGLEPGESQYTLIPNDSGGAVDDAYLYRFTPDEYLLVVNASNREKDLAHFAGYQNRFDDLVIEDRTFDTAMISLQGPASKAMLYSILQSGSLPEPMKNRLSIAVIDGGRVMISRTGYTGEPLGFELILDRDHAVGVWNKLLLQGAQPAGLGARDTLRLEACLPLYGHELGLDAEGNEIPIYASPLSRFAVSLSGLKGDFVGRPALTRQFECLRTIINRVAIQTDYLPKMIMPVALTDRGVLRAGCLVYHNGKQAGAITSGTMVPYWKSAGSGLLSTLTDEKGMRSIGLALLDSHLVEGDAIDIDIRGKMARGIVVPYHLRSEAPPAARPIPHDMIYAEEASGPFPENRKQAVLSLVKSAIDNTRWRQQECINLIPSEQISSSVSRMLSILDPCSRYAEHKKVRAFNQADVFYYQGIDFIAGVEARLQQEMRHYLGCNQVEVRPVSGQMANVTVFSALVDYLNQADRKSEQRRLTCVMNNHIIKGGHLSAQPMGALRDFVARDPATDRAAVVNFPVLAQDPFKIDIDASAELIARYRPELIVLGKSMVLYPEPILEIRQILDSLNIPCVLMVDMAHVLGLVGPWFQQPFLEGADVVTGSTHKTFFGTQRGVIASDLTREHWQYPLWEAVERRAFPGSVSNHHLGTLLGLLMAAYEMNNYKDDYQRQVIANAKAFAVALNDSGFQVAGDPSVSFTRTHQVILQVGYGRGPEVARRLEDNGIIVNYQAGPDEEGFSAAGYLRMGVSEMTRFGMKEDDFKVLAGLMQDAIILNKPVKAKITEFRKAFLSMQYCFTDPELDSLIQAMHGLI